jgi:hypothetical protein
MNKTTLKVQDIELGNAENERIGERSRTRNNLAVGSEQQRQSVRLLGEDVLIDEGLRWRVKWGQRILLLCGLIALASYIASGTINIGLPITAVSVALMLICASIFFYKNISFVVMKRLLHEPNVIIIAIYTVFNFSIDIVQPNHSFSSIFGFNYMFLTTGFVFCDALKLKSRILVITVGSIFTFLNLYNIYLYTFRDTAEGIILLKYTIQGKEHSFMKRSMKRSIFFQILLFSMSGIYTMIVDKKQEQIVFATENIYYRDTGTTSSNRGSMRLLGEDSASDEWLKWRVKWGQRGIVLCLFSALVCFIASNDTIVGLQIATLVFGIIGLLCTFILYYKNVSFVIATKLFREPNFVIIFLSSLCNCIIDIVQPNHSFSPIFGIVYVLVVTSFVFQDAVKVRSRILIISAGSIFTFLNLFNISEYIFGDTAEGAILLKYTIQGKEHSFMKRSIKRAIFFQILLFSVSGIYTMIVDKKQERMMFATGNIYRETGTTSKHVEDVQYSMEIKRERILSSGTKTR